MGLKLVDALSFDLVIHLSDREIKASLKLGNSNSSQILLISGI